MKKILSVGFAISCFMFANPLLASNSDDVKWIAKCLEDNKNSGVSEEVVYKYCSCMNSKMSDDETKSISEWEKTHQKEMKECEKKAGWN